MPKNNSLFEYRVFDEVLKQQQVALTAAEMHGLISGLVCGGNKGKEWQHLVYQLTNDGIAFPLSLLNKVQSIFVSTAQALDEGGFMFDLFLPADDATIFERADALAGWTSHFLLGLGMMQPELSNTKGSVREVIDDLRNIAQLGYDETDDIEELSISLEEIIEYVRVAAMLCHAEFIPIKPNKLVMQQTPPTLH